MELFITFLKHIASQLDPKNHMYVFDTKSENNIVIHIFIYRESIEKILKILASLHSTL